MTTEFFENVSRIYDIEGADSRFLCPHYEQKKTDDHRILNNCELKSAHILEEFVGNLSFFAKIVSKILGTADFSFCLIG